MGRRGESIAASFLASRGHEVLARRFRTRRGEIDLVTRSGEHLYFVEVKTRRELGHRGDRYGGGIAAIPPRKRLRMELIARTFLARAGQPAGVPHFGVLVVEEGRDRARLRFVPDAFDAAGT
jgi:putative endonuclease